MTNAKTSTSLKFASQHSLPPCFSPPPADSMRVDLGEAADLQVVQSWISSVSSEDITIWTQNRCWGTSNIALISTWRCTQQDHQREEKNRFVLHGEQSKCDAPGLP